MKYISTICILFILMLLGCRKNWSEDASRQIVYSPELGMTQSIEVLEKKLKKGGIPYFIKKQTLTVDDLKAYNRIVWDGVHMNMKGRNKNVDSVVFYEVFTVKGREKDLLKVD